MQGGFGAVWKAHYYGDVAVKTLKDRECSGSSLRKLIKEIHSAAE